MTGSEPLTTSYWPADESEPLPELTVGDLLREAAADAPDRIALVEGIGESRRRWTYRKLLATSERVGRALCDEFDPGDRVAVWAPNIPEWLFLEFGAALAGLVLVTVNPAYRPQELRHVLGQSGAAGLFMVDEFRGSPMREFLDSVRDDLPALRQVIRLTEFDEWLEVAPNQGSLPEVDPRSPAQIQYTSGTTGVSKGALLTHRAVVANARFDAAAVEVGPQDVWLDPMPLFHCGGCVIATLGSVWARATHIPVLRFDPPLILDLVEQEHASVLSAVPTMIISLMEDPTFADRDLSWLRAVVSGGSKVAADLVRLVETTLGARVSITYGQTEASPVITQTHLSDSPEDKAETIGRPHPHTEVKIADLRTGEPVPIGAEGELCTRGYLVMDGYFEMAERTAEAIDEEGWLHTGDLCMMDERGYCSVEGRLKDMIIRGGENIYPREIEEILYTHAGVGDVAVVGAPDPKWGEQIVAFVRPSPGAEPSAGELSDFVRSHLSPQKVPKRWYFVDSMPLTPSGKIQKFELRRMLEGAS
jgi:fatty-acyl-CoA synthase